MISSSFAHSVKTSIFAITIALLAVLGTNMQAYAANPRHAVLIYDADTKQVMYHENGYDKRYPASLTKMMTLYLLFEELRSGRITLDTPMKASQFAASQPQTNISLRKGDTVTVEQAIKALVVRSANDVAVVVAEHLGGSQSVFARKATQKAKHLGMTNTVFKNPHGLPDSGQYTSALDMAILGASLRRDFPQYYGYFKTLEFNYKGKRFTSHNRVLDKLPGIDGIKTGYINASGFNLVSSLKNGHANIVAVVMGGTSGRERDDRMVSLLKVADTRLAQKRGNDTNFAMDYAPLPQQKPVIVENSPQQAIATLMHTESTHVIVADAPQPVVKPDIANAQKIDDIGQLTQVLLAKQSNAQTASTQRELTMVQNAVPAANSLNVTFNDAAVRKPNRLNVTLHDEAKATQPRAVAQSPYYSSNNYSGNTALPPQHTLDYQLAALSKEFPVPEYIFKNDRPDPSKDWAVQIGVFKDTLAARRALSQVARNVRSELKSAIADVEYAEQGSRGFHRARLKNLDERTARTVCSKLNAMKQDCFAIKL